MDDLEEAIKRLEADTRAGGELECRKREEAVAGQPHDSLVAVESAAASAPTEPIAPAVAAIETSVAASLDTPPPAPGPPTPVPPALAPDAPIPPALAAVEPVAAAPMTALPVARAPARLALGEELTPAPATLAPGEAVPIVPASPSDPPPRTEAEKLETRRMSALEDAILGRPPDADGATARAKAAPLQRDRPPLATPAVEVAAKLRAPVARLPAKLAADATKGAGAGDAVVAESSVVARRSGAYLVNPQDFVNPNTAPRGAERPPRSWLRPLIGVAIVSQS